MTLFLVAACTLLTLLLLSRIAPTVLKKRSWKLAICAFLAVDVFIGALTALDAIKAKEFTKINEKTEVIFSGELTGLVVSDSNEWRWHRSNEEERIAKATGFSISPRIDLYTVFHVSHKANEIARNDSNSEFLGTRSQIFLSSLTDCVTFIDSPDYRFVVTETTADFVHKGIFTFYIDEDYPVSREYIFYLPKSELVIDNSAFFSSEPTYPFESSLS